MSEPDSRYKLVYDEALGAIDRQERTLDELRSRVSATLATTVIATAFFGGIAIKPGRASPFVASGGRSLFVIAALLHVVLLLPLGGWRFRRSPAKIIRDYVEDENPATLDEMYRELALNLADDIAGNDGRLSWMWWVFTAAVVVLVAEVVTWLVAISVN